jgi:hypothetical protein
MSDQPAPNNNLFSCHVSGCSRSFKHKEHLTRHQASHKGLRLYTCPTCSRSFTRRYSNAVLSEFSFQMPTNIMAVILSTGISCFTTRLLKSRKEHQLHVKDVGTERPSVTAESLVYHVITCMLLVPALHLVPRLHRIIYSKWDFDNQSPMTK